MPDGSFVEDKGLRMSGTLTIVPLANGAYRGELFVIQDGGVTAKLDVWAKDINGLNLAKSYLEMYVKHQSQNKSEQLVNGVTGEPLIS